MKLDVTTFVLTLAKFICHKKVKKLRQELLQISSFSYLGDFFLQDGLIFLVVNLKRGSPSHVLASVVAPFLMITNMKIV